MAVIYEVTLNIDRGIATEYDVWLAQHAAAMLALPGFLSAEISTIEEDDNSASRVGRVVHYRLDSREALDAYFRDQATHMRDDGIRRFGKRFSASRRILVPVS